MAPTVLFAFLLLAQQPSSASSENQWTFTQSVQGSVNESGVIVKSDSSIGRNLNRFFTAYAGVPLYFVHGSSTTATTSTVPAASDAGLGNVYGGLRLSLGKSVLGYSSNVSVAAPTGNEDRGFSTGRVTADWTNTVHASLSRLSPYASAGLANTVSDTAFFVRPFASHGTVAHFEGGTTLGLVHVLELGGSLYAVKGSGEQEIVSRVKSKQQSVTTQPSGSGSAKRPFDNAPVTTGSADIANDRGFSTWLAIHPHPVWNLAVGYNRSATYGLDSVFFGLGFHVSH
jgi:hypothetical protein